MYNNRLKDKTIVVTRPKEQSKSLKNNIEKNGGIVIVFPTLTIKPIKIDLKQSKKYLFCSDFILFLSANAVRYAPNIRLRHNQKIIAIGPGTANALHQRGMYVNELPQKYSSEGLLQLPILKEIYGKTITLLCGENTRPYLINKLKERGSKTFQIFCYRRGKPLVSPEIIVPLTKKSIHAIVSTSVESLHNLKALFSSNSKWLRSIPLLVVSELMRNTAISYGFNYIMQAENPTEIAIIETLQKQLP